jgi:hypothetical protein
MEFLGGGMGFVGGDMKRWLGMIGLGCTLTLIVEGTVSRLYHSPEPWQHLRMKVVDTVELSWMALPEEASLRSHPWLAVRDTVLRSDRNVTVHNTDDRVDSVVTVEPDETYGTVTTTYRYSDHRLVSGLLVPFTTITQRMPGNLCDTMVVRQATVDSLVTYEHLADGVHGIILRHADTRSIIVEFADHLLLWGAPLTSLNGELLLQTIGEKISTKPIRYAGYGHFHSHYTGGLRPFAATGTTILAPAPSAPYIREILGPAAPIHVYHGTTILSDSTMEARLITIGMVSAHTTDFTLLYLPRQRILIQDDLAWIPVEGAPGDAGPRQKGLVHAIDSLKLDVDTIIQGWPVAGYGRKTVINVEELR